MKSFAIVTLAAFVLTNAAVVRAADIVTVDTSHLVQTVHPQSALGSTVDKEPAGSIPSLYSATNVRQMLDAGWGWLSYRLFTELSDQDWHWNPAGRFSTPAGGYWTSSDSTDSKPIADSYGYWLEHTGNTSDQGNNENYSRLVDGDAATYWKSNPYLAARYTGDDQREHPQWIVIDAGASQTIDGIRVAFADPYATSYRVEYWTGADPMQDPAHGAWRPFRNGAVDGRSRRSVSLLRAIGGPHRVRFLRVLLVRSSNTCDTHGPGDPRNCAGFAVSEVYAGRIDSAGRLHDVLIHRRCGGDKPRNARCGARQSATYVSSVDPWHAATDRVRNQEQPGLDLIARSGLTRSLPAMYPVPMLYSTPENAVAEVRYLRARGYAIEGIELGEEPDGQYVTPEDDAALYVRWARAIHAADPSVPLGGPVFSGVNDDLPAWPDATGNVSWLNRFLNYLRSHGAIAELAFMSFEHYPFDGCETGAHLTNDLLQEPGIVRRVTAAWRRDGLPAGVPMYVTEANFSAVNFTETPMTIEGALWQADYMGSALENGVAKAVYYQYEPVPLSQNSSCPQAWGNLTMFVAGRDGTIRARAAQFWAARMITGEWLGGGNAAARLFAGTTTARLMHLPAISVYPLKRTDGKWSIMLVNKDVADRRIALHFSDGTSLSGPVERVSFGPSQYRWQRDGSRSRPSPNGPPLATTLRGGPASIYVLPGRSITVLRGKAGT